ncbi:MAG: hemerythrin [Planctomycetota bacterium]|nr:MAG: hemerythrin [Planctomycetota bacterium]
MIESTDAARPCAVLKAEHQVILRVIEVLKRLVARIDKENTCDLEAMKQCVTFFRFFADACHHAKEEDLLFPVLEERGVPREGGPIGCMLEEHRQARAFTREMDEAVQAIESGRNEALQEFRAAAQRYIDLLTNHIFKEDNVLFMMGDHVMTGEDQDRLGRQFGEVGCRRFGGKTREELERMAEELEKRWSN